VPRSASREETPNSSMISVRIPSDVEDALRLEAEKTGKTLSQLIRQRLAEEGAADLTVFPATSTTAIGGLALEAVGGELLPRNVLPYISISHG